MVLTSKWGIILQGRNAMPMTNRIKVCAQWGQTGRNVDKIPHHTSKVNYVRMVLHCAVGYQTGVIHTENWGLQLDKNYIFSFRYKLKNKYQINYKINYTIPWRPPAQPRPSASDR